MSTTVKYGTKTNPQAGDTVVSAGGLTAGRYRVIVQTLMSGTIAAGDVNNVQLIGSDGGTVSVLLTAGAANVAISSPTINLSVSSGGTIAVKAVANASGTGAIYGAVLVADPDALFE